MKTNWEVLNDAAVQGNKEKVCDWLRKFKNYPHTPVGDYLEMDSDEPWLHEVIAEWEKRNREELEETARKLAEYPEIYAVSAEELKKALFGDFKRVE